MERLPFHITDVARLHAAVDMTVLAVIVALLVVLFRRRAPRPVLARLEVVLVFGLLQAAIGYTQYFTGVPEVLVALHILGATLLWSAVLWFYLGLSDSVPDAAESGHADERGDGHDAGGDRTGRDVVTSG